MKSYYPNLLSDYQQLNVVKFGEIPLKYINRNIFINKKN